MSRLSRKFLYNFNIMGFLGKGEKEDFARAPDVRKCPKMAVNVSQLGDVQSYKWRYKSFEITIISIQLKFNLFIS